MHITALSIENFRAIESVKFENIPSIVIIAGPNGSGKSTIFEAIRLVKLRYAGYTAGELDAWYSDNGVQRTAAGNVSLLRDKSKSLFISITLSYTEGEAKYLLDNARAISLDEIVAERGMTSTLSRWQHRNESQYVTDIPEPEEEDVAPIQEAIESIAELREMTIGIEIQPDGQIRWTGDFGARGIMRTYQPKELGIIDYHGAGRSYAREGSAGTSLNFAEQRSQEPANTIANWRNKYTNIKASLGASHLRSLISTHQTGVQAPDTLENAFKDLFATFFPDKNYAGIRVDESGALVFAVESGGATHDLDDLSSGEKEILYGYLRMREQTPRNSVILLDEPELHLNPALVAGLADFYHRTLVTQMNDQVWMITHSDTLIRSASEDGRFGTYHLTRSSSPRDSSNQVIRLDNTTFDAAIRDLVGDLASFNPFDTIVFLEGEGREFDKKMIRKLFPVETKKLTFVSAGSKTNVRSAFDALRRMHEQVDIPARFWAITDSDSVINERSELRGANLRSWNVYHIENYLLDAHYIRLAATMILSDETWATDEQVEANLLLAAEEMIQGLANERLHREIRLDLNRAGTFPRVPPGTASAEAFAANFRALIDSHLLLAKEFSVHQIEERHARLVTSLEADIRSGDWKLTFPGRDVLKRLIRDKLNGKVNYEAFANLVISAMLTGDFKPDGMTDLLREIPGTDFS